MKTPTYHSWIHMRSRCNCPNNQNYSDYGGRGITVCERWNSFELFLFDMGECPKGFTLERKDVNKGYSPENCCWATRQQQSRNRRDTVYLTKDGITRSLAEWADLLKLKPITIHMRLKRGMSHYDALKPASKSRKPNNKYITYNDRTLPVYEWAKIVGIPRKNIISRLDKGWSVEQAFTTPVVKLSNTKGRR